MSRRPGQLDEQQAQLVERLRAAGGAPVSFEELRAAGIENPALLCYELAAVGLPITRTCAAGGGMPALSVRLEDELEPEPAGYDPPDPSPVPEEPVAAAPLSRRALRAAGVRAAELLGRARPTAELGRRARREWGAHPASSARLMSILALAAAVAAVVAIALGASHNRRTRADAHGVPAAASHAGASPRARPTPAQAAPKLPQVPHGVGSPATPTPVSPAAAVALEADGHQLLAEGSYPSAIPRLLAAIRASGQSLAGCVEPASEACLTFAYALYDLGRALRLQGRHAEAVAVLSERLRIDNQRATVQHELDLARGASA
jgi:tetratricopeptide (TPR) repeat protein